MKTVQVHLRYLSITPRKVRLLSNTLKGLTVQEAEAQLMLRPQRASEPLLKLLRSGVANIKNTGALDVNRLVIASILVNPGPTLKRSLPRAQGRATPILKRMAHVTLVLGESEKPLSERFVIARQEKKKKKDADKEKSAKGGKAGGKTTGNVAPKPEAGHKDHEKPKDTPAKPKHEGGAFKRFFRRKSV